MEIRCFSGTTTGRRPGNEDALYGEVFKKPKGCLEAVAAVFDGMGGHQGGETASRMAAAILKKNLSNPPERNEAVRQWMAGVFDEIQESLVDESEANKALQGMGTTSAVVAVSAESVWIGHLGDSRVYSWVNGSITQLTVDHSAVQDALGRGLYTLEQFKDNQALMNMSSALTQFLGVDGTAAADIQEIPRKRSEALLLCTDGLTGNAVAPILSEEIIISHLINSSNGQHAVANLLSRAYQIGSRDNITAVLLELGSLARPKTSMRNEPDVEKLRKSEGKRGSRRPRKKTYRILTVIISCLILILIGALVTILLRKDGPRAIPPKEKSKAVNEASVSNAPTAALPAPTAEPEQRQIHWSNSYDGEKITTRESIHFSLSGSTPQKMFMVYSRQADMNGKIFRIDVTEWMQKEGIPLSAIPEIKAGGLWYLRLETGEHDDPRAVSGIRAITIIR